MGRVIGAHHSTPVRGRPANLLRRVVADQVFDLEPFGILRAPLGEVFSIRRNRLAFSMVQRGNKSVEIASSVEGPPVKKRTTEQGDVMRACAVTPGEIEYT